MRKYIEAFLNDSLIKKSYNFSLLVSKLSLVKLFLLLIALKQERSPIRGAAPHPAFRERGRAIPAGAPLPPSRAAVVLPPHQRVRSPIIEYFKSDQVSLSECACLKSEAGLLLDGGRGSLCHNTYSFGYIKITSYTI